MRVGKVIGRVTLSQAIPMLAGARWLVVSPHGQDELSEFGREDIPVSKEPSLVVYDNLGGGVGDTIGFVEGREAASPFDHAPPIDAINAALIDEIFYSPKR